MRRLVIATAVFVALLVAPAFASVTFNGDFEAGMAQWPLIQNCGATRATTYTASSQPTWPAPVHGTTANRTFATYTDHWTGPGDQDCNTSSGSRRSQFGSSNILTPGSTVWQGWWGYVPTNFNTGIDGSPGRWFVFQEDFGWPFSGSPPFSFDVGNANGVQSFKLNKLCGGSCATATWSKPIVKGAWHHFVVQKRISSDDSTAGGFYRLW